MKQILGNRILVIGAHPDDEVLGCGGLLAANANAGGTSDVLIVTDGSSAQHANSETMKKRRHEQLLSSSRVLGVRHTAHWSFPDMRLDSVDHVELNGHFQSFIESGSYDYVFVHHPFDVNQDHQVVFRSALVACRPTPGSPVSGMFTYHVNSSTEWGVASEAERFVPTAYLDIGSLLEIKAQALSCYEDELREYPHPRSLEAVRNRAKVFGADVGVDAAEAFHLIYLR